MAHATTGTEQADKEVEQVDGDRDDDDNSNDAGNRRIKGNLREAPQKQAHDSKDNKQLNESGWEHG
jgi:hypothetical protein